MGLHAGLSLCPTGIERLDHIVHGGIPRGQSTIVTGVAGSGKTLLALQFLLHGVRDFDESGVLVTFAKDAAALFETVRALGWDPEGVAAEKRIAVVDASPEPDERLVAAGPYDLSALLVRIQHAVSSVQARRVVLDAIGSLFPRLTDPDIVRRELGRVADGLRQMGVTTLVTIERAEDDATQDRWGVQEFIADDVILLGDRLGGGEGPPSVQLLSPALRTGPTDNLTTERPRRAGLSPSSDATT